jgi:hypothetical protein
MAGVQDISCNRNFFKFECDIPLRVTVNGLTICRIFFMLRECMMIGPTSGDCVSGDAETVGAGVEGGEVFGGQVEGGRGMARLGDGNVGTGTIGGVGGARGWGVEGHGGGGKAGGGRGSGRYCLEGAALGGGNAQRAGHRRLG